MVAARTFGGAHRDLEWTQIPLAGFPIYLAGFLDEEVVTEVRSKGMSASIFMEHIEPQRRMLNRSRKGGQDAFTPLVDNIEKSTDEAVIMVMRCPPAAYVVGATVQG